jgi:hypothetical protein
MLPLPSAFFPRAWGFVAFVAALVCSLDDSRRQASWFLLLSVGCH